MQSVFKLILNLQRLLHARNATPLAHPQHHLCSSQPTGLVNSYSTKMINQNMCTLDLWLYAFTVPLIIKRPSTTRNGTVPLIMWHCLRYVCDGLFRRRFSFFAPTHMYIALDGNNDESLEDIHSGSFISLSSALFQPRLPVLVLLHFSSPAFKPLHM